MALWRGAEPLVLASRSEARRAMLQAAGLAVEIVAAEIDERAIEKNAKHRPPQEIAALLAREKARNVAGRKPGRLVLAADQTLALGARSFSKPADRDEARAQLRALRGKTHALHSVVIAMRDGAVLFEHCASACLTMRDFSEAFIEAYLDATGADAMASVGSYQLERLGIHLFERIEGDHFTILGLPLLPLLQFLRREGLLAD